jgi:hypothetical protein
MKRSTLFSAIMALIMTGAPAALTAQAFQGYTLYSGENSRATYLIDMNNTVVHSWTHSKTGGYSCYLLSDGSLMRSANSSNSSLNGGGATGVIERVDWYGNTVWTYTYSSNSYRLHHDFEPMPNGNVLMIAWEVKSASQAVAAGLNHSATIWPDHIIEVQPSGTTGGNIVWQWHAWDHLIQDYNSGKNNYGVVAQHPELLNINMVNIQSGDWMHLNAISYNPTLDQIVVSSHNLNEIYVIDHSTTTAQAATHSGGNSGKGGDILYRWGCPGNYGASGTKVFDVVHCSWWIPAGLSGAGDILVFNNRQSSGASMVVQITPPGGGTGSYPITAGQAFLPASTTWSYAASGFYSDHLGSCQRLPNGNTLMAESTDGKLREVNSSGVVQWSYSPGGSIPRCLRYDPSYSGLISVPVELQSFRGYYEKAQVHLAWSVATERMNYGFSVERCLSSDTAWTSLGFVAGRGTTSEAGSYEFDDASASNLEYGTVAKYRLRQLDMDGNENLSPIVEISISDVPDVITLKQNYPNPVVSKSTGDCTTNIAFDLNRELPVTLKIFTTFGKEVSVLADGIYSPGTYRMIWNAAGLSSGVYLCRLTAGSQVQTRKIIVAGK